MFQIFLRYDPLCKTKPNAKIFSDASTQNIPRKYTSVFSYKEKSCISLHVDVYVVVILNLETASLTRQITKYVFPLQYKFETLMA